MLWIICICVQILKYLLNVKAHLYVDQLYVCKFLNVHCGSIEILLFFIVFSFVFIFAVCFFLIMTKVKANWST